MSHHKQPPQGRLRDESRLHNKGRQKPPPKKIPPPPRYPSTEKPTNVEITLPSDEEILPCPDPPKSHTEYPIPPSEYPIPSRLSHELSRRNYLREKLLRMKHHVKYLAHCERKILKGLRITISVNRIEHNTPSDTHQHIDAILCKADKDVVDILTTHCSGLLPHLGQELERLETVLHNTQTDPHVTPTQLSTIYRAKEHAEWDDDRMDGRLDRERADKLGYLERINTG